MAADNAMIFITEAFGHGTEKRLDTALGDGWNGWKRPRPNEGSRPGEALMTPVFGSSWMLL